MATAKIQTANGFRVEFFRIIAKKLHSALTGWIVGTDIKCGLLSTGRYAILCIKVYYSLLHFYIKE